MSVFYCHECDRNIDSDFEGCEIYGEDLICETCFDHMLNPIVPLHNETTPRWPQDSPAVRAVPTLDDLRAATDEQYEAFQVYWAERNEGKDFTESRLVYFAAMERFADLSTQRFMARMNGALPALEEKEKS